LAEMAENNEVAQIGLLLKIDPETRDIKEFNLYGADKFPCSVAEIIGWLTLIRFKVVNDTIK